MKPRRKARGWLAPALVLACHAAHAAEAAFPRFAISDVQADCDVAPSQGAKLCTVGSQGVCFTMPSALASTEDSVRYKFALDPRTERLPLVDGGSWVFFSASFSACGSGMLERIAILRFKPSAQGGSIANLMPYLTVSNVSDRAIWSVSQASRYPLYVQADFEWHGDETHFGAHYFNVEVWRFDPATLIYMRVLRYRTAKRYDGGDGGRVRVLGPERAEILRRLAVK